MSKNLKSESMDILFKSIITLQSLDECYKYFDDLFTVNELKSLSQRFEVARMLYNGATYTEISSKTGASAATISRINNCVENGSGGYAQAIERIKK